MNPHVMPAIDAITPLGWGVGVVGVCSLVLGMMSSWVELVAIGIMGIAIFLVALFSSFGRVGHSVVLHLSTRRVTVGERALGELVVANPTSHLLPATLVELSVGSSIVSFSAGRIASGEEQAEPFGIATSRRGIVTVGPARATRGDPLGLVKRRQTWSDSMELYIHPRTVRVGASALGFLRDVEGRATRDFSSTDVSFHTLRDYVAGDDRRAIHWRTTAHVGKLMVRQFEEIRRAHLLIILDLDEQAWGSDEEFEDGVSAVASLAVATMRESKEVSIMTQAGQLKTSTGMHVLDSLAGVAALSGSERLPELARRASVEVPQASVVAIVTGSLRPVTALSGALTRLPLDTASFGVRFSAGGNLELRVLGGCTVVSVPSLDDFARGMRRLLG